MTSAPGKAYLLVVGTFYIISGVVGAIFSLNGLFTFDYLDRTPPTATGISWSIYYTVGLIGFLLCIITGVMGVINRSRLEKASLLRTLGIIYLVYVLLYRIFSDVIVHENTIADGFGISLIMALFISALYIVGAQKNLTAYTER